MVEYSIRLDSIFNSLADATRRDILKRVAKKELSISEIAASYEMTFAAISKHLQVLQRAKLIKKERRGRVQVVRASPAGLSEADRYLGQYRRLWEERLDRLEAYLAKNK